MSAIMLWIGTSGMDLVIKWPFIGEWLLCEGYLFQLVDQRVQLFK